METDQAVPCRDLLFVPGTYWITSHEFTKRPRFCLIFDLHTCDIDLLSSRFSATLGSFKSEADRSDTSGSKTWSLMLRWAFASHFHHIIRVWVVQRRIHAIIEMPMQSKNEEWLLESNTRHFHWLITTVLLLRPFEAQDVVASWPFKLDVVWMGR